SACVPVLADRNLRRVELAFLGFNMTESATWIAILDYAFERGGGAEMGAVSAILLLPSAIVAPFAAYAGDRFRRDRVLAGGCGGAVRAECGLGVAAPAVRHRRAVRRVRGRSVPARTGARDRLRGPGARD